MFIISSSTSSLFAFIL
jgi:hypothetical protein